MQSSLMLSVAIIVGAALIAGAAVFGPARWEIAGTSSFLYRLDRWTGAVTTCDFVRDARPLYVKCS
jgi:hypothetical protein